MQPVGLKVHGLGLLDSASQTHPQVDAPCRAHIIKNRPSLGGFDRITKLFLGKNHTTDR
jgi:hypothetical protein